MARRAATACPSRADLEAFARGAMEGLQLERLVAHLETCAPCEATLCALDDPGDALLDQLAHLGRRGSIAPDGDDDVPPELLRSATAIRSGAPRDLVVDFGRRVRRELERGPVRLGKFALLEEIGAGTFGHVFRARDTELERTVAVKVQRAGSLSGREEKERFLREARSAARLAHAGIVAVHETGETEDGACYLVTEFIEGETLEERLGRGRPGIEESARVIAAVASALDAAHTQGVVHRDVKPSNILLDRQGRPHVTDFGLAKRDAGDETVTAAGAVVGTPAYMSPEQARGDSHHVDARTDIYSLGAVFYEMLTGDRPFQGNGRMLTLQVLEDEPRPARRLDEKIPRDLDTICLKAMEKSPARRFATAREMEEDIGRWMRGEAIRARPLGRFERAARWCRRYPLAASVFVAVTISLAVGLVYISSLYDRFVRTAGLRSAADHARLLEEVNLTYSEVVDGLHGTVRATHRYPERKGTVPFPATFTMLVGERLSAAQTGMRVRLYSDYPFPWRKDGGPHDDFERSALARLRERPGEPVHEIVATPEGPQLRYATARVMDPSCVGCHNHHPSTPKNDWKVGDVRGVLEIVRPLDVDTEEVRSGLEGAALLVVAVAATLFGLALGFVVRKSRRRPGATAQD